MQPGRDLAVYRPVASSSRDRAGSPRSAGAVASVFRLARNAAVATAVLAAMCVVVMAVPVAILRHHLRKGTAPRLRRAFGR